MNTYDIIIIGYGPAGASAAIYAARANKKVLMVAKDGGALSKADKVDNYYGFAATVSGRELIDNGLAQAVRQGVVALTAEALGIKINYENDIAKGFLVETDGGSYGARAVILATGASRHTPKIKGIDKYEGKGVSYCAICDAFFFRGKDVAVLGNGPYALHEVNDLLQVVGSVAVLTNGGEINATFPDEVKIIAKKISNLSGEGMLGAVQFDDGDVLHVNGLFVAEGVAGSVELARKIGAFVKDGNVVVGEGQTTDIPGLYAAGDCTGGMKQIAKAVYEGALAGTEAAKYVGK